MQYFRGHYLPRKEDWLDWRASPLLAKSLAGLPPAFVLTAGFDPLLDEGRAVRRAASAATASRSSTASTPTWSTASSLMGGVLDTANAARRRLLRGTAPRL